MSEQAPIRVGIAGLGRSGWDIHARLLEPMAAHYRVVAVADADPARRAQAEDRFDCLAHATFADLLADRQVEVVVVALPSHLHAQASIDALAAGKHVVCEKPMAVSLAEADRMVAAAAGSDRVLTIFQNRRYNPDFLQVRQVLERGLLGRIVQIRITESKFSRRWDWQTLREYGGGTLNNTGPHFLDQALQLFGPAEPEIFCHLDRTLTLGDADDHVKVVLKGANAPTVDVEVSSCDAFPRETWHIMGTQGGLRGSTQALQWRYFDPAHLPPRALDTRPTPDRSYNRDEIPWQEGEWTLAEDTSPGHSGFYRELFAAIRHGAPVPITPESVQRVIRLQEACHRLASF